MLMDTQAEKSILEAALKAKEDEIKTATAEQFKKDWPELKEKILEAINHGRLVMLDLYDIKHYYDKDELSPIYVLTLISNCLPEGSALMHSSDKIYKIGVKLNSSLI